MPETDAPDRGAARADADLAGAWERLCRCVDEFEPADMGACEERQQDLYGAVERAIPALAALCRFRDAIDRASQAYHGDVHAIPARFERGVRVALKRLQDARDEAPAPELVDTAIPASSRAEAGATGPDSPVWSTDADLAHIRAWHWPMQRQERDGRIVAVCKRCGTGWPCHAALLVTEVDRLCAEAAALRTFRAASAAALAHEAAHAAWLALVARGGPTTTDHLDAAARSRAALDEQHAAYAARAGAAPPATATKQQTRRAEHMSMKFVDARDLIEQTPLSFETKNVVAKGFAILARYGDDLEVAAGHDVIWVGQGELMASTSATSAEDLRELAALRWFLDEHLGCWGHYV